MPESTRDPSLPSTGPGRPQNGNFVPAKGPRPVFVLKRGDVTQPLEPAVPGATVSAVAGLAHREQHSDALRFEVAGFGEVTVNVRFDGEAVRFEAPEYGVAPGQATVIYEGSRVLGGGWIEETVAAELEPA